MQTQMPNVKEIGNSINSMNLEYAEITKYFREKNTKINEEEQLVLSKLKFFYMRNSHLIAIQYIYQANKHFKSNDKTTYVYHPFHRIQSLQSAP